MPKKIGSLVKSTTSGSSGEQSDDDDAEGDSEALLNMDPADAKRMRRYSSQSARDIVRCYPIRFAYLHFRCHVFLSCILLGQHPCVMQLLEHAAQRHLHMFYLIIPP